MSTSNSVNRLWNRHFMYIGSNILQNTEYISCLWKLQWTYSNFNLVPVGCYKKTESISYPGSRLCMCNLPSCLACSWKNNRNTLKGTKVAHPQPGARVWHGFSLSSTKPTGYSIKIQITIHPLALPKLGSVTLVSLTVSLPIVNISEMVLHPYILDNIR